ncbi:MAG: alkaline phosphatase family protein [Candidatus Aminicenantes bacterium]|nr:alkaline phosphatase family protein [Candidatus Aminicenantes bacterium]
MKQKRLLVIGLDCAPPALVFERAEELPHLKKLMENGVYGNLRSCDPPITIPAWMVMATGRDPGQLGLFGFRHRQGYSYNRMWIANSTTIKEKTVWDYLSEQGKESILVGVPPSYPPKPVKGKLISCFITPSKEQPYTYPESFKQELEDRFGGFIFDVVFRTQDRAQVLQEIYQMTTNHFQVIDYLIEDKNWRLFWFVEIGVDRMHHAFWKFMDREHHLYEPGNPFETAIFDYYKFLDENIGRLLEKIDDRTAVLVVSDHGAKRMKGAFCINDWLIEQGDLVVTEPPEKGQNVEKLKIDWSKTRAWGWGGYYARIFLNVEGREPQGIIKPEDYEAVRDELAERIKAIRGPQGEEWKTVVIKPQEHYPELNGDYPDLMVYFDDLYWRSAGTLGYGSLYLEENDTGPDDAVHDYEGIYILYDPERPGGRVQNANILDIAPTILTLLEGPEVQGLQGKSLW